ncbi:hypothetical protein RMN64_15720 [Plesiomonas shigelloides]|uniref:hypothetical protein n=1 Tax=Plesiomonas shigelloides TaxID=703 RepID=UPI002887440A|nr:hypothetical protein [Plesiomonas shigelloides]MDT1012864.1 hypothetical protein [Plesiomonas shigelloides]
MKNTIIELENLTTNQLNDYLTSTSFEIFFDKQDPNDDTIGIKYKNESLSVIKPEKETNKIKIFSLLRDSAFKESNLNAVESFADKMTKISSISKVVSVQRSDNDIALLMSYHLPAKGSISLDCLENIIIVFHEDIDKVKAYVPFFNEIAKSDI